MKKYKHIKNHKQLSQELATIVKNIHHNEDPFVLTEYKRLFTSSVGIFSRANVAAYLIKKYLDSQNSREFPARNKQAQQQRQQQPKQPQPKQQEVPKATADSTNQRRHENYELTITRTETNYSEFKKFLTSLPNITSEDIVHIRLGEKNSTVRVRSEAAKSFVTVINGAKFKSVTLQATHVAYKRNRRRR